ncbi:metallophosphoesterase family protein [Marinobacter alexandrii]|uniref:metallophosphoesterase family protein n=1 Tax=Marinobacter alexandrii TaxID=2570351 RepID=UPI003D6557C1
MNIGVIADAHSKMRPEALDVLKGSELILHAGDCDSRQHRQGRCRLSGIMRVFFVITGKPHVPTPAVPSMRF